MANITILVGTVYGNALDVAELCQERLAAKGHQVTLNRQATIDEVLTEGLEVLLICTSTTGQGEIPDNLLPFYCHLQDRRPDLTHLRYGLVTLGDSSYDTFAEAGWLMNELLQSLELERVGELLVVDACETRSPRDEVLPWVDTWSESLD